MYKLSGFLLLTLSLLSCKQQMEPGQIYRGILILGSEVSDFRDCEAADLKYWVIDETGSLDEAYSQVAQEEYEAVYVEIEAIREAAPALGYAGERDGQMRIKKISRIEKLNRENDCMPLTLNQSDPMLLAAPSSTYPVFADSGLAGLYERYLDLKGALVAGDETMANKSARALHAIASKYPVMQPFSQRLSETNDLGQQRSLFAELNAVFIPLLRKRPPLAGKVFLFASKEAVPRYWLASEARINNPYDGSKENAEFVEILGQKDTGVE